MYKCFTLVKAIFNVIFVLNISEEFILRKSYVLY